MGYGFKHGVCGASELNYAVVAGTTRPENPRENTIWVNMSTKLADYTFGDTAPESPVHGSVWICVGSSGALSFNALKKNCILLHPVKVYRYIITEEDGETIARWDEKEAEIYQNGAWVDLWNGQLYESGNEFEAITGGWVATPAGYSTDASSSGTASVTKGSESMSMTMPNDTGAIIHTKNKIDLSGYSTLIFDGTVTGATQFPSLCNLRVWSEIGKYSTANAVATLTIQKNLDGEVTLDISGLDGEYYVGIALWTGLPAVTMRSLRME